MIRNVVFDMGGVLIRYDFFKVLHALRRPIRTIMR